MIQNFWYNVFEKNIPRSTKIMIPYCAPSVHHTDKLLPYGTAKEIIVRKKCCSGGKTNYFLRFDKMKNQGLIYSAFGYSGLKSTRGY